MTPVRGKLWLLLTLSLVANAVFIARFFLHPGAGGAPGPGNATAGVPVQAADSVSSHRTAIVSQQVETPFWIRPPRSVALQTQAGRRGANELDREQTAMLQPPPGADDNLPEPGEMQAYQCPRPEDLPREKRQELQSIASDYAELSQEIYARSSGLILLEDREKLAFIEKEKTADLAKVLTPPALEDYINSARVTPPGRALARACFQTWIVILSAAKNPRGRTSYRMRTRGFFAALRMTR